VNPQNCQQLCQQTTLTEQVRAVAGQWRFNLVSLTEIPENTHELSAKAHGSHPSPATVDVELGSLGVMRALALILVLFCFVAGCSTQPERSVSVETDWPYSARAAVYSQSAAPSFDSPEGVTRLLEQRWSLADIRTFCVPARRHNPMYQNLVLDEPEAWKGRLYSDQRTGFDAILWYASVRDGQLIAYSLGVYRRGDYWLLEIGTPKTVSRPALVTPDPSVDHFLGRKRHLTRGLQRTADPLYDR
jgi:hypothetical protein